MSDPTPYGVTRKPGETWRQLVARMAEPFDRVQPCLSTYQTLIAEFTDPDNAVKADAAWDALLLGGCLQG